MKTRNKIIITFCLVISGLFSNLSNAQTIVWSEGFEGLSTSCGSSSGSTLISTTCTPSGWLTSKNYPWIATSSNQYAGSRAVKMTAGWTGWLISAGANLTAGTTYTLKFWYKRSACSVPPCSSGYTVKVGVTQTQTTVPSTTTTVVNNGTQSAYTQFSYTYTPTTSGMYYFGLQMSSSVSTAYDLGYIDDISLSYTCSTPTAGTITPASANVCVGDQVTINSTADATAPNATLYTQWDRYDYATSSWISLGQTNTQAITDNPGAGQYYYRRRVWSDCYNSCSPNCIEAVTGTVTVGVAPSAASFSSGPLSICAGASAVYTATVSGTSPTITYAILSGGASIDANTGTVSNVTSDFTVRATGTNGCGFATVDRMVTVNANPVQPTIVAGGPLTFCQGGHVNLTSSYASGNSWSVPENSSLLIVTNTGNYAVTHTDANGCSATSLPVSVTVNPNPMPVITASSLTFCEGDDVELTSSATSGNIWSTTETSNSITIAATATITVTETDANGCVGTSAPITVTENPNPAIPVITADGPLAFCEGGDVMLSSSYTTGNSWSSAASTQEITVDASGSFSVTHTDVNGCSSTSLPTTVTENANPAIPVITVNGSSTFCEGGNATLVSSASSGNTWSTTETSNSISVNSTGTYGLTITDANGCSATAQDVTITVNSNPTPVITANGPTTFCAGGSVTLNSSSNTGNVWSTNATNSSISVNTSSSITVTQTDANGCSGTSAPVTIVVNAAPATPVITPAGQVSICQGSNTVLTSSFNTGNTWSTNATTNTITVNSAGSYTVTNTDANGCSSVSAPVTVTVNSLPVASASLTNQVTIAATPAGQSYQWINCANNQPISNATAATFTAPNNGSYAVIITNAAGCKDTSACVVVSKADLENLSENIGIIFYPNPSDGLVTIEFESGEQTFDLSVYDASGKEISIRKNMVPGKEIDLRSLKSGIYLLKIRTEKGNVIQRMIKN